MRKIEIAMQDLGNSYGTLGWLSRQNIIVSFSVVEGCKVCEIALIDNTESLARRVCLYCDMKGDFTPEYNNYADISLDFTPAAFLKLQEIAKLAIAEFERQWANDGKGQNLEISLKS